MVDPLLVAKLVLTPTLIGAISLAARRFGPAVGGTLAGLPWTSGTLSVFLAIEAGPEFADDAARATAGAVPAVVVFCLVYALLARRGWLASVLGGLAAFLLVAGTAARFVPRIEIAFLAAVASLLGALLLFPTIRVEHAPPSRPPWDIPARMVAATTLVLLLTGFSQILGPAWTGALSPFPVFASVLATFTHRHDGPHAAISLLRGVLVGLLSFSSFFLVVGWMLPDYSFAPTYAMAVAAALGTNALAWLVAWLIEVRARIPAPTGVEVVEEQ